jgi:hypothetical protein
MSSVFVNFQRPAKVSLLLSIIILGGNQMKTTRYLINITTVMAFAVLAAGVCSPLQAQKKKEPLKIGVFDSRVVLLAYSRSAGFGEKMKSLSEEADKLLKSGDTTKMKKGAMMMISRSFMLESGVFSNASAKAVIGLVKDQLAGLAEKTGVSMIVCKWELSYSDPSIELLDVTAQVADLFKPVNLDPSMVKQIADQPPMTQEEYGMGESIDMWEQFRAKYKLR